MAAACPTCPPHVRASKAYPAYWPTTDAVADLVHLVRRMRPNGYPDTLLAEVADALESLSAERSAMLDALRDAEEVLGGNLVWIRDQVDLAIRQGDVFTMQRVANLESGWQRLCAILAQVEGR